MVPKFLVFLLPTEFQAWKIMGSTSQEKSVDKVHNTSLPKFNCDDLEPHKQNNGRGLNMLKILGV